MSSIPQTPSLLSRARLANLATPDSGISSLQTSNPQLFNAIKNLGQSSQQLINSTFPPPPVPNYRGRIIIPGIITVANDILSHRYHVVLPTDPSGYWTYVNINLFYCYITAKVLPITTTLSVDVKISQLHGTSPYKSIFQPGFNPMLPANVATTHNVKFAINVLSQDDLGRVDVLTADGTVAGVELVLVGNYTLQENQVD